jgi:hypothetical protein
MEVSERDWDWGRGGRLRDVFHKVLDYFIQIISQSQ